MRVNLRRSWRTSSWIGFYSTSGEIDRIVLRSASHTLATNPHPAFVWRVEGKLKKQSLLLFFLDASLKARSRGWDPHSPALRHPPVLLFERTFPYFPTSHQHTPSLMPYRIERQGRYMMFYHQLLIMSSSLTIVICGARDHQLLPIIRVAILYNNNRHQSESRVSEEMTILIYSRVEFKCSEAAAYSPFRDDKSHHFSWIEWNSIQIT